MLANFRISKYFDVKKIDDFLKSLPDNEQKLKELKELYKEFVTACYNTSEAQLESYKSFKGLGIEYMSIPHNPDADIYQTHISSSQYVKMLRKIDTKLLPYIRKEIKKLDKSFEEDKTLITKDYPIFNFDKDKVIDYIDKLKKDKLRYIRLIHDKRCEYYLITRQSTQKVGEVVLMFDDDELIILLRNLYYALERYPERINEKTKDILGISKKTPELFKKDKTLYEFEFGKIKEHAKKIENANDAILYLLHVRKEALQNKKLLKFNDPEEMLVENLDIEINFYKDKQKIENALPLPSTSGKNQPQKDPIRLHWQKDNVLLPYLMISLVNGEFISNSDNEKIFNFIEQSFYKASGGIFTADDARAAVSNYNINKREDNKGKPSKAYQVDTLINNLKEEESKLSKKKTVKPKKK